MLTPSRKRTSHDLAGRVVSAHSVHRYDVTGGAAARGARPAGLSGDAWAAGGEVGIRGHGPAWPDSAGHRAGGRAGCPPASSHGGAKDDAGHGTSRFPSIPAYL